MRLNCRMIAVAACLCVVVAGCSDDDNQGNQNNLNNQNNNNSTDLCGNGAVDPGEDCDGAELDGATCETRGFASGDLACSGTCTFDESDCDACGNDELDTGEACDDGNNVDGDGCSADCMSDETCGNNIEDPGEACDDGNTADGDGCSANCMSDETCGNGYVDTGEDCDDGTSNSDTVADACRTSCMDASCGDGAVDTGEDCDDGDLQSHDMCSSGCVDETLNWAQLTPDATAAERYYGGTTYDSSRNRVVLFGGSDDAGFLGDTWEFDGVTWVETSPTTSPSARLMAGMSYDASRNVTVLFGGGFHNGTGYVNYNDTWEYDGTTWTQITTNTVPPVRRGHMMAYDSQRGVTVMFGGWDTSQLGDTWEYDGTDWTLQTTTHAPAARNVGAFAFDSGRNVMVLNGGSYFSGTWGNYDDTWEYDGTDWTQMSPTTSPSERRIHTMVYDPLRSVMVMFGGYNGSVYYDDTWEYDGTTWTQLSPATSPSARYGHSMVYSPLMRAPMVFGGTVGPSGSQDDTWVFRPESATPNERCDNAADDDGDGAMDCADPDCDSMPCATGTCTGGVCQ